LKKAYSEINQAIKLSEVDNGNMSAWFVGSELQAKRDWAKNYFIKYFKVARECVPLSRDCFDGALFPDGDYGENSKRFGFITISGYSVMGWTHGGGNGGWLYVDVNGPKKGPNTFGNDIFALIMQFDENYNINGIEANKVVDNSGVFFAGLGLNTPLTREELINGGGNTPNSFKNATCNKESNKKLTCGALIVTDGWRITDDYPW